MAEINLQKNSGTINYSYFAVETLFNAIVIAVIFALQKHFKTSISRTLKRNHTATHFVTRTRRVLCQYYPQWTKGHTVGKEPIFAPASLLSFRVRPVRVNHAPRRDKNWLLSDSLTLTIDIPVIYKAEDWGVLDVHWLRTTQKMTGISWFRACVPLATEGIICLLHLLQKWIVSFNF